MTTIDPKGIARGATGRLARALLRPLDAAALSVFRVVFGLLVFTSAVRFLVHGWVDEYFVRPRFFFHYWGFAWVEPLPAGGMHALFVGLAVVGACIAAGLFYRLAIKAFFVGFTFVILVDKTNYINHYYFVSLIALLMAFMPLHRAYSLDARISPEIRREALPAWCTYLLRFQVGVVYVFAGLAKVGSDWLLHAQPLNIWLSARADLPLLGPWLGERAIAYAASWAGCLFDLSIVVFLSIRRTRLLAYAVVLVFHTVTKALFPIGMFPFIMVAGALVFFPPGWPRALLRAIRLRVPEAAPTETAGARRPALFLGAVGIATLYCALQVLAPLRTHLYGGDVLWHEQGMRLSWRVMLREKNGSVTYYVTDPRIGRTWQVNPRRYLDARQAREFSTQPDMILELAHRIARDFEVREGLRPIVRAEALVSLNGRPAELLIDPDVDLASVRDGLAPAAWIRPAPEGPPIHLRAVAWAGR